MIICDYCRKRMSQLPAVTSSSEIPVEFDICFCKELTRMMENFSDEQLLLELRNRGRLDSVEYRGHASGYSLSQGMPRSYLVELAMREIANLIAHKYGETPELITGFEWSTAAAEHSFRDVKFKLPLNFIVEKSVE